MSVLLNLNEDVKQNEVRNEIITNVPKEKKQRVVILGISKSGFEIKDIKQLELVVYQKIKFIDSFNDRHGKILKDENFDVIGYAFKKGESLDYLSWALEIEESPNVFLLVEQNGQKVWTRVLSHLREEDRYEVEVL